MSILDSPHPNAGEYPRFGKLDDLISIEDLAARLKITRKTLIDARYDEPGLPFIRLGKRIYLAEPQFIWWLNEKQKRIPDKYWMDRKRRLSEGAVRTKRSSRKK